MTVLTHVQINDMFTNNFLTTAGVRQRDPLSSTVFSIYINDFPSFISEDKCVDIDSVDSILTVYYLLMISFW